MVSVNSPIRKFVKPILFKLLNKRIYSWFQYRAKIRDIKKRLVEEKEMQLLPQIINDGDEVLDLGANYAYYTIRMSELVRTGKVFAFEPIPITHQICKKIVDYFKADNVELFQKAVGEKNEIQKFRAPLQDFDFISAGQAHIATRNNEIEGKDVLYKFDKDTYFDCEIVRLDDFLKNKLNNLSFVKIDIEGAELFALKGMTELIKKFKPVILMEIVPFFLKGFKINEKDLLNFIKTLNYKMFLYDETNNKLIPHKGIVIESNYILIHKNKIKEFDHLIDKNTHKMAN